MIASERRMRGVDQWLKKYRVRSTLILSISIGQMLWVTWWSTKFAATSSLSGTEMAVVIAAVQVPVTLLFNSVYKTYQENKIP
jgi:hypothetical protein